MRMADINRTLTFLKKIVTSMFDFITENDTLMYFILLPVITLSIFLIFDFIFDIRDNFSEIHKFQNYLPYYKYRNFKQDKKQKQIDMDEVYRKSRENADYKHRLKMEEYKAFSDNYNKIRENQEKNNKRYESANHFQTQKKRVNLDVEYED